MVRQANKSDLEEILKLSNKLFLDESSSSDRYADSEWPFSKGGRRAFQETLEKGFLWVAEKDSKIVGFLCGDLAYFQDWRPIRRAELISFYIEESYRSMGIGSELVDSFFEWVKLKGAKTVFVSAYADNKRGIGFYRKMGFEDESLTLEKEL